MTYQYLTVEMVKAAKANGGFIAQKTFKRAGKYGLDFSDGCEHANSRRLHSLRESFT